ncbi:unnamed protein product [Calypogeia fissa]
MGGREGRGGGGGSKPFSSSARSVITVLMASAAILLVLTVFLIFDIIGLPLPNNNENINNFGYGPTISLRNPLLQNIAKTSTGGLQVELGGVQNSEQPKYVETLSWEPRASLYHNMLTDEECEHLINLARPNMVKSQVIDRATGLVIESEARTSTQTYLRRGLDPIVERIERRIADFTFLPVDHGEGLQILHYGAGQKYLSHYDYAEYPSSVLAQHGGQCIATVLMYLSDVQAGGETLFPAGELNYNKNKTLEGQYSECAKHGLAIRPKKGMALLFWTLSPDVRKDLRSINSGCPVLEGDKWTATKWLHVEKWPNID